MAGWKVSLSNGETFYEGKGNFEILAGEKSPWQRLKDYIQINELKITSLGIFTEDNKMLLLIGLNQITTIIFELLRRL